MDGVCAPTIESPSSSINMHECCGGTVDLMRRSPQAPQALSNPASQPQLPAEQALGTNTNSEQELAAGDRNEHGVAEECYRQI